MKKYVFIVFILLNLLVLASCSAALSTIFKLDDAPLFKKVKSIALVVAMDTENAVKKKDELKRTITTYENSISVSPAAASLLGDKLEQV